YNPVHIKIAGNFVKHSGGDGINVDVYTTGGSSYPEYDPFGFGGGFGGFGGWNQATVDIDILNNIVKFSRADGIDVDVQTFSGEEEYDYGYDPFALSLCDGPYTPIGGGEQATIDISIDGNNV